VRFQVLIRDRLGALAEIARILSAEGINIQSLISWPIDEHPGVFQLVMRVAARDLDAAVKSLEAGGFAVLTRHVKDLTPYIPKA
jgi:acetoin utilization protein AcuB